MSHAKRNSIGQLALPTTLVTVTPGSPTTSHSPLGLNSPTTTSPTKPSFGPVQPLPITTSNIQLHNAQYPASASTYTGHVAAFTSGGSITSPVSPTSVRSTHAGGIQPNASFFRPVRPGQYNNSPGRLGLPPRFDDSSDDDDGAASSVDHNQRPAQKNDTLAPRPHPLSTSLSHSSSLSAHQHHHSNHSSELVKAHEDGNRTSDEQPPQTPHGVSGKPSKEFLLSGQQANGNPQAKSKRVSIDASAIPPPSSLTAKRNSASYKPRLTFESLRRSMDSATGSKRFSFGRSNDNSNMVLESGSDGEGLREETGIPLTPRSPKAKRRSKLYRSTSASSVRSGISSAAGHFVDRMTVANDEGVLGEDGTEDRSSSATPTPTSFDPRPPPLEKGEYPLMKTPLYHPLDPSLVPERRLQKMQKRGRKGYVPDSAANGRTKAGSEGSLALPTTTRTKRKSKGFLTFLYPSPPATPTADGEKTTKIPVSLPVSSAPKEGTPVKRWFLHPSRNSFFFGGRCMTGGDNPWPFILTLTIVCGVAGVWFGCVGRWWWVEGGLGVANEAVRIMNGGVEGNVIGSEGSVVVGDRQLYVVNPAARRAGKAVVIIDPGVLPRNLDPDPPYPATSPLDGELRTPMPRDLKVRSDVVTTASTPVTIIVNG
ncbi:zinc ion binding protein [Coprinopsis cinerea okayama7|uniref:Zinc ion binding protein n=1 Tax=Coprinopsis cinerea (strain Okayama-7 / 130 / ATCC MYA-4618 / FGSC 9003) TaxID=240176 RepID=A8NEC4_COPC7|nr:zinc ion binding protein [Coprinopsis cinerea okayama7\|eukprot:XP_001832987.2 zinc ion binding protein [Coprinopsis cinerea okayama7\